MYFLGKNQQKRSVGPVQAAKNGQLDTSNGAFYHYNFWGMQEFSTYHPFFLMEVVVAIFVPEHGNLSLFFPRFPSTDKPV